MEFLKQLKVICDNYDEQYDDNKGDHLYRFAEAYMKAICKHPNAPTLGIAAPPAWIVE